MNTTCGRLKLIRGKERRQGWKFLKTSVLNGDDDCH